MQQLDLLLWWTQADVWSCQVSFFDTHSKLTMGAISVKLSQKTCSQEDSLHLVDREPRTT
jgi:hypothetical protein